MSVPPLLRDGLRPLLRRRGITAIIVITLALGVGVNVGIFSIFQQVLLQKLPVPNPDQLYALSSPGPKQGMNSNSGTGGSEMVFSHSMWRDLSAIEAPHEGIAGFRNFGANLAFDGATVNGAGGFVTSNYFDVLGLAPVAGRLFRSGEFANPGEGDGVVLSHAYWQRDFGSDPDAVGRSMIVNGKPFRIVGVAPRSFVGLNRFSPVDVFVPLPHVADMAEIGWELEPRNNYWMYAFTRIPEAVGAERVRSILEPAYRRVLRELDAPLLEDVSDETRQRFVAKPLELIAIARGQARTLEVARAPLNLMLAVTGVVLLVACVNIANLLLALALSDRGETAVRMALGAGRRQVMARQAVQLGFLGLVGALASLPVGLATLHVVLGLLPENGPAPVTATMDWKIASLAVVLAGLVPMIQAFGSRPIAAIREQAGRSGASRFSSRMRSALVTGQMALALALLTISGLFIQSMVNIARVDLGMNIEQIVQFSISPAQNGYPTEQSQELFRNLRARLAALPEVESASVSLVPLLSDSNWDNSVTVEGFDASSDTNTAASFNTVGEGYFDTLEIPLLAGRRFASSDSEGRPNVAIVNRAFADKFEMGDEVVGKRMARSTGSGVELDIEIVGLIADARYATIKDEPPPQFYLPMWQFPSFGTATFYVRSSLNPAALMPRLRDVVAEFDPNLPIEGLATLERFSQQTIVLDRLMGTLAGLFAGLATVLAAVGLFGVLSFTTAQRSSELGLRGALGASPDGLKRMVLAHALRLGAIGGVIGLALALLIGRAAAGLLYGISPWNVEVMLSAAAVLLAVIIVAGWLPARRAASVQPVQALRYE
jgi:predicted permease